MKCVGCITAAAVLQGDPPVRVDDAVAVYEGESMCVDHLAGRLKQNSQISTNAYRAAARGDYDPF